MNGLGVLIVLACAVVGCLSYRDYRIPIKGRRGSTYYATRPQKIVGDRHRNYKRGVNKTHPFELGIGVYYQMDIMLKPETDQNALVSTNNPNLRWPNAIVPYRITGNFTTAQVSIIQQAMTQYAERTCVRFVPYTTESTFVTIGNSGTGCWSYVGRSLNNSYNQVNLQVPSCMTTGTVAHELMHALGFKHEFSRPDRDDWVSIDMGALAPEYQTTDFFNSNFGKMAPAQVELYGIPYYYGSVMHYSKWGGAVSYSRPVMNNLKPWAAEDFGNEVELTPPDVLAINYTYCNGTTLPTTTTAAPTTTTTKAPTTTTTTTAATTTTTKAPTTTTTTTAATTTTTKAPTTTTTTTTTTTKAPTTTTTAATTTTTKAPTTTTTTTTTTTKAPTTTTTTTKAPTTTTTAATTTTTKAPTTTTTTTKAPTTTTTTATKAPTTTTKAPGGGTLLQRLLELLRKLLALYSRQG
ncbi:zinc metalloproteinase nas-14-like isoform X1 [Culex pipiens pallens]|uniref:zinc metalloproteinase nas-14-like isoform X1 n=1 Tax=Culex pipiens pallens TaxID=42434 RepID=UPI001953E0C7|nr:zinc metalloproteinase nas-14-like isoform X1 [Culex pipiens pallens]